MISWVIQYFLCIEVLPWTTYTVVGDIYVLPNGRRLQSTLFFKRLWISSSGLPQRREGSTGYFRPLSQHQSEEKCLGLTDTNLKVLEWPEEAAVTVLVTQSGLTLCHPGTAAHQAPLSMGFPGKWVAMPCSRGSPWPRDWTCVSCIAGSFFTDESLTF